MSTILALTSSALAGQSASSQLVGFAVDQLVAEDPGARVVVRDLGADHIPHLDADSSAALRTGEAANPTQARALALSGELLDELRSADTLVIGAPMYNFGISTTLKAWFDYVLRAGQTFSYSEAGPKGLLTGKRALAILSRGGMYSEGPAQAIDFHEPHLLHLLGFMGITDTTVIRAEPLGFWPEARAASLAAA
ncbi:MAG: FMN-dependent NADH-azoreductase, partial [Rhizobiales bacterium]|nr:FMN-dependent NADH-azoreductase [Hyphomicrobiales bacterium]